MTRIRLKKIKVNACAVIPQHAPSSQRHHTDLEAEHLSFAQTTGTVLSKLPSLGEVGQLLGQSLLTRMVGSGCIAIVVVIIFIAAGAVVLATVAVATTASKVASTVPEWWKE